MQSPRDLHKSSSFLSYICCSSKIGLPSSLSQFIPSPSLYIPPIGLIFHNIPHRFLLFELPYITAHSSSHHLFSTFHQLAVSFNIAFSSVIHTLSLPTPSPCSFLPPSVLSHFLSFHGNISFSHLPHLSFLLMLSSSQTLTFPFFLRDFLLRPHPRYPTATTNMCCLPRNLPPLLGSPWTLS